MKKLKSLFLAAVLTCLALTGCGTQSHHGTYQFQMGKSQGSHIGIYMNLTKEMIEVETDTDKKEEMEKFVVKLSIPDSAEKAAEDQSLVGGILTYFKQDGLQGGYKIIHDDKDNVDHLLLYPIIDISELLNDIELLAPSDSSSNSESSSSGESSSSQETAPFVIPSKIVDNIMIATYSKDSISVTVPVSLTDLMFQLYWYGFDIFDILEEYPITEHEHGTHPTPEDVIEINKTYNSEERLVKHCNLDVLVKYQVTKQVDFRDFNQLTMSLKKAVL